MKAAVSPPVVLWKGEKQHTTYLFFWQALIRSSLIELERILFSLGCRKGFGMNKKEELEYRTRIVSA